MTSGRTLAQEMASNSALRWDETWANKAIPMEWKGTNETNTGRAQGALELGATNRRIDDNCDIYDSSTTSANETQSLHMAQGLSRIPLRISQRHGTTDASNS
jgi:hypothetical protein